MKQPESYRSGRQGWKETLRLFLFTSFFAGLLFGFRAVSSISIMLMTASVFLELDRLQYKHGQRPAIIFFSTLTLYLIIISGHIFLGPGYKTLNDIQLKSGMLFAPLSVTACFPSLERTVKKMLQCYVALLLLACIYCLAFNFRIFINGHDDHVFFYHELVRPLHQHAVYFSFYTLFAILVLVYSELFSPGIKWMMSIFLSIFLFLLSSKLVIAFYLILLIHWIVTMEQGRKKAWLVAPIVTLPIIAGILISNPVSERFRDIFQGDPELASRDHYDPSVYFNGVQFRLLQWRIVPAILNEQERWVTGVGPANAQHLINIQYEQRNLYLGKGDSIGYKAYNTHNQLLESLLRYGIIGLLGFVLVAAGLIGLLSNCKDFHWKIFLSLILLYSLLESMLETQYGIIIFTFLPVFVWYLQKRPTSPAPGTINKQ